MATLARKGVKPLATPTAAGTLAAERTLYQVGFWAATLTAILYVAWLLGAGVGLFLPATWALVAMSAPSLLIPLGWIPLMLCVRRWAAEDRKIFGDIASIFAALYGALVTMNYFVALTVTVPKQLAGADTGILTTAPGGFFGAVEALGYSLMSLSALFAGFVFTGSGLQRWIRRLLLITGFFAVVLPWQMLWSTWPSPPILVSIPREFALPAAVILLAVMFRRGDRPAQTA